MIHPRLRIGMLFFATSFPILVGTPIDGALLGSDNTYWYKAIIFSGVSVAPRMIDLMTDDPCRS